MAVRLSILFTGCPFPPGRILVPISVRSWVDPAAIMQLEVLGQLKNSVTSSEFKPITLQLVTQCLNQLYHCVPPFWMLHQVTIWIHWDNYGKGNKKCREGCGCRLYGGHMFSVFMQGTKTTSIEPCRIANLMDWLTNLLIVLSQFAQLCSSSATPKVSGVPTMPFPSSGFCA